MKPLIAGICALVGYCSSHQVHITEVETAFLQFDQDNNGVVTKDEMLQSVMKDINREKFSEQHHEEMVKAIDEMMNKYDLNGDGLDFMELYAASGGNLEDL